MPKFLLFVLCCITAFSCKKDTLMPLPNYNRGNQIQGWFKCDRNGVAWEASANAGYMTYGSTPDTNYISIGCGTVDNDTILGEILSIQNIPTQVGAYDVVKSFETKVITSTYSLVTDDQIDAIYQIRKKKTSKVYIDAIDRQKRTVKGRYTLYFSGGSGLYERNVDFENGMFEVNIIN
jgi:hypothetical protein